MKPSKFEEFRHQTLDLRKGLGRSISAFILYSGMLTFMVIAFDIGFTQNTLEESYLSTYYKVIKRLLILAFVLRNALNFLNRDKALRLKILDGILLSLLVFVFLVLSDNITWINLPSWIPSYKFLTFPVYVLVFAIEFSRNMVSYYRRSINPALIFVISFMAVIIGGTLLLLLPNASTEKLSIVDALFTSASAVCITGLIVQDTATFFTPLGQLIILFLIQIGGLGIITFTGFIGQMFSSGVSFQQRLLIGQINSGEQLGKAFKTITQIIFITLLVELIGAIVIYFLVPKAMFDSVVDHVFFSVFHSVSAFCNAGFSTLTLGLFDIQLRYNYVLLIVLGALLVFGGLGFPIVLNVYYHFKHLIIDTFRAIFKGKRFKHVPYVLNFNSKIILITTAFLIVLGWIGFFFFEYSGVLAEHSFMGKIAVSFFGSVTPRTAGFNSVDMTVLSLETVVFYIFLMWIGASPGGTGGGVKTTTFAVAVMNFIDIARGRERMEVLGREVPSRAVNQAFAIISMSLVILGTSSTLIYYFDPQFKLIDIVFECFSAFSTVGLSLGITGGLSDKSKLVLVLVMIIGRVGTITFLMAFIYRRRYHKVRYPNESILF